MTPQEYVASGDRVIVSLHMIATGRGSGLKVERDDALVHEMRDGKTVRVDYFNSRQQAFDFAAAADEAEPLGRLAARLRWRLPPRGRSPARRTGAQ
jgi:hypothetical protein